MKKHTYKIGVLLLLLSLVIFTISCNDDLEERNLQYPQLNPTNPDANAGTWTPLLLTSPDEFSLDAPLAVTTNAYKAEINEIKSYQANITDDQKKIIDYFNSLKPSPGNNPAPKKSIPRIINKIITKLAGTKKKG